MLPSQEIAELSVKNAVQWLRPGVETIGEPLGPHTIAIGAWILAS